MSIYNQLLAKETAISVIGLGYVGLPLAVEFSQYVNTIGFDVNPAKIAAYQSKTDPTGELDNAQMAASHVEYTTDPTRLKDALFHIIAVPTPITIDNLPDLSFVAGACEVLGPHLAKGAIVVCESTVYPGATEEICIPILEKLSGLKCGVDFKLGYSPERINPGDKEHTLTNIVKVVSGMDKECLAEISNIYAIAIKAGVYPVSSIKTAEAVKVVENTQRNINIGFMNEVAMLFDAMDIDTFEVLGAMNTKWNALGFTPGLVGGHCISVDPHYLMSGARRINQQCRIIKESHRLNDVMASFVAKKIIKQLVLANKASNDAKIALLGITFKANTADTRNSKVVEVMRHLEAYGINLSVVDPVADKQAVKAEYDIDLVELAHLNDLDCIIVAVPHNEFASLGLRGLEVFFNADEPYKNKAIVDIQGMLNKNEVEEKGYRYWRL